MVDFKCKKCHCLLNNENAYTRNDKKQNRKNKLMSYCKKCFSSYCIDRWKSRKKKAVDYKGGKCSLCGYSKYYGALEFHHIDRSSKKYEWKELRKHTWSTVIIELDKCILLCSNCHKEEEDRIKYCG